MALAITIEGKGVIANADASPDTAMSGSAWNESGGGTDSFTTDTFLYGTTSFAGAYSAKSGYQYYDIGSANILDFDTSGAEEGQHIYMWINCPTIGLLQTKANKGLTIRLGTDLDNNYREFLIAGSDDANGWNGGWKCFVIDPTKTGSVNDTGNFDVGAVRYFGVWIDASALAKGDNIFISQISVGKGIRVIGTSVQGWKDVVDYCTDYPNRAWGAFQEREGIYYQYGKLSIGNTLQGANVSFTDSGRIIQFGESEYWNGTVWVTSADIDYSGLEIQDHASYTTTFSDGVIVGTENGRSGSVIIGHANHDVAMDLYGGNNASSVTTLYGTTLKDLTGALNSGNNSGHKFLSVSLSGCSQFDPVGAPVLRNMIFSETIDVDAALLWNENIDIKKSNFIANTLGAAIEMLSAVGTPYAYDALFFSGNTNDVLNSSGSSISVNKNNLSDPTSSEGAAVTFLGTSVTTKVIVIDSITKAVIQNAAVFVKASDGTGPLPYEDSVTITRSGTTATVSHTAHGLSTGQKVEINGANQDEYNRIKTITVTTANAYTFAVTGSPATPATGTIISTGVLINDVTDASGQISDTRSLASDQPFSGTVKKGSDSPVYVSASTSGTVDKDAGLTTTIPMIGD